MRIFFAPPFSINKLIREQIIYTFESFNLKISSHNSDKKMRNLNVLRINSNHVRL